VEEKLQSRSPSSPKKSSFRPSPAHENKPLPRNRRTSGTHTSIDTHALGLTTHIHAPSLALSCSTNNPIKNQSCRKELFHQPKHTKKRTRALPSL